MSTLVCIIGNLRGGPTAWSSLGLHLLQPLRADLAILIAYGASIPSELRPVHVWRVPEPSSAWDDVLDELYGSNNWSTRITRRENLWGGLRTTVGTTTHGSGAIVLALRWWLLRYLDALNEKRYDAVVVTRSDQLYACDHPPLQRFFPPGVVATPSDENYGGVTDRHTIFKWTERRRALAVLPWLIENDNRLRHLSSPEQVMLAYYNAVRIRIRHVERSFFTIRRPNDMTRWTWSIGSNQCTRGLYLKYENELIAVRRFCNNTRVCPLY